MTADELEQRLIAAYNGNPDVRCNSMLLLFLVLYLADGRDLRKHGRLTIFLNLGDLNGLTEDFRSTTKENKNGSCDVDCLQSDIRGFELTLAPAECLKHGEVMVTNLYVHNEKTLKAPRHLKATKLVLT